MVELPLLLAEPLHHPHAGHRLLDDHGDLALALLGVPAGREGPLAHPVGGDGQRRHHHQADHRQQRRVDEHDDQGQDEQQHVAAHDRQERQQPLQQADVGVGPADQLPGLQLVVAGEVEPLELVVDGVAQVELHVEADAPADVAPDVGGAEAGQGDHDQQREPRPQRLAVIEDDVVDDLPFDGRHRRGEPAAHQRPAQGQEHVAPVRLQPRRQPPDPSGWGRPSDQGCITRQDMASDANDQRAKSLPAGPAASRPGRP